MEQKLDALGFLEEPDEAGAASAPDDVQVLDFSTIECYPGGLTENLRMEFKGEDVSGLLLRNLS